jgi:hypothetical protein
MFLAKRNTLDMGLLCVMNVCKQMVKCARSENLIEDDTLLSLKNAEFFWKWIPRTNKEPLKLLF